MTPENQTKTSSTTSTQSTPSAAPKAAMFGLPSLPSFDPMAMFGASQQAFAKLMTDAYGRVRSFADQIATVEGQLLTRAQGAVSSWAQLTQDAIAYTAQLSAEARKLGLESMHKMNPGS